ncbi:MAG: hypothetical protein KF713_11785 [Turneriella sp.]|nr:hypothetical protein [Turneriella sp.]
MKLLAYLNRRDLLFRASAFFWGFSFFLFFRYLLDAFFPFYRGFFPLTQFALVLFAVAFLAAALYNAPVERAWKRFALTLALIAAVGGTIFSLLQIFGADSAYLLFPIPLTLLSLVLWYELARHAFFFQPAKIYLLAGVVASLYAGRFLENPRFAPAFAIVAILFARAQEGRPYEVSHERLLTLRQLIDFLRYLFLAQAFHATLGQNREHLLFVVLICAVGLTVPQLIRQFGTVRPHIQQGLMSLPVMFIALAVAFNFLHYTYWGAAAYSLLAIWEGVYFSKAHEIYLRREKILAGLAIVGAISGYYIASEWLQILLGVLIALFLAGILIYVAKNWRKAITALFAVAVLSWVFAIQWKYSNSVTREFFRPPALKVHKPQLPDAGLLMTILALQKNTGQTLFTNMLPTELLNDASWQGQNIATFDANPAFFALKLGYACYVRKWNRTYFLDEKSLENYAEPTALVALRRMLDYFGHCEIYLADGGNLRSLKSLGQNIAADTNTAKAINAENAPRLLSLARAEKKRDRVSEALNLYEQIFPFYKDDPVFLRDLSALAAARGLIDRQIQVLTNLIDLKKDNTTYDKKLLMELYAIKRDRKKSAALAYEILADGSSNESPLAIYSFLQKLFSEPFDRYEMESLYRKISSYQPKTDLETLKHAGLKRSVEEMVKQNPTYDVKYHDENHRQEYIAFPE